MLVKIFFILLQGVLNTRASGSYYISDTQTTWKDASKTHTFATPDINYNENTLSINIDIELNNTEVWIGYFKALTALDYFGCMRQVDISSSKTFKLKRNGPGLCFSACGKKVLVGLRHDKCYCLENEPNVDHHLPNCDKTCGAERSFLCGGDDHISLYKINKEVNIPRLIYDSNIGDNSCLRLSHGPLYHDLKWKPCESALNALCTFVNGTILSDNGYHKWKDATKQCFQLNGFATSYANVKFNSDKLPTSTSWTRVIGSSIIYKYDANSGSFSNIECGYTKDSKELLFTEECSIPQNVIFQYETSSTFTTSASTTTTTSKLTSSNGGAETETSSTIPRSSTSVTTTSKLTSSGGGIKPEMTSPSGILSTSLAETVTSPSNISTSTEPVVADEQEIVSKGSDVGAIVGASVVSILVVIVAVVVFVILKRRKKLPVICKGTLSQKESGYQQSKRTTDQMSREDNVYDHAGVVDMDSANTNANNPYAHTYFVLEPHVNESNTDDTTYDTSGNDNKTVTETDNVYNKLELDSNKTYDHAHTNIRNGICKPDDTYDTTEKAAMKLKARPSKDLDKFGDTGEDEYSHITKKQVNNIRTDNVYGVPNNLENAYGDVGTSNRNNPHDEGDTYSHINNKR